MVTGVKTHLAYLFINFAFAAVEKENIWGIFYYYYYYLY